MARKLTEVEVFYIQNNTNMTADQLSNTIKGVDVTAIQAALDSAPAALKAGDKGESALKGKTEEEVKEIVKSDADAHRAGNLFARREGVTVMTEAAGELADARKILRVKQSPSSQSDKIHVIDKNRTTR